MEFSRETNKLEFKTRHHYDILTTTIYLLHPPQSVTVTATNHPFITAAISGTLRHNLHQPLTTTPHLHHHFPPHFNLVKLRPTPTVLSVSHHAPSSFDKLLVVPTPTPNFNNSNIFKYNHIYDNVDLYECSLFALYDGGRLRGCPPYAVDWIMLSSGATVDRFDDIVICKGKIYVVDREGRLYSVYHSFRNRKLGFDATLIDYPLVAESGFGWRKRAVVCGNQMYLIVRVEEKLLEVYKLIGEKKRGNLNWDKVRGFNYEEVLFIGRDCYFFVDLKGDCCYGRELENCIVFTEGAFPKYGNDCWELSQFGDVRRCADDIAVFRVSDGSFSREGENGEFPTINWASVPPDWIRDVWSGLATDSKSRSSSQSCRQSKSDTKDGEVQSKLKEEEMKSDSDKEQEGTTSDSEDRDGEMQCDLNDEQTKDEEITRTLLCINDGNVQGTLSKNITQLTPRACTTKSNKSDATVSTKFAGLDVRSDLVPTLQMIWQNHGNIIANSSIRSGDIIGRALESLATVVRILEDNSAQSLSSSQADFLSSTLSDLRYMHFKVNWLIPFVEKVVKLHKSKHLLDSLNNLSQLSAQAKKRKAILMDELSKLGEEENKLKEEITKVSKMIPFSGEVKFDKPVGSGLTKLGENQAKLSLTTP